MFNFINSKYNFLVYTLLNILLKFIGLFTSIIIIRKLSVNDFGHFSVILMIIAFLTNFGFSWSSSSIIYFGSKEKMETGSMNKTFWSRNIIIFVTLGIVSILFVVFNTSINEYIGINTSYWVLIWLYFSVIENYLQQYFLAVKRQLTSVFLSLYIKLFLLILLILFDFSVLDLVKLNVLSYTLCLFFIFYINKSDIGRFEFDEAHFKMIWSFSIWQLFGFAGLYIINFADIAIIKAFMDQKNVAYYNAAYQLFLGLSSFAIIISNYFASHITTAFKSNNKEQIKKFYYNDRFKIFIIALLIHVIIIIFSYQIILMIYGEKYLPSVIIFNILVLGSLVKFYERFYMLYYNSNNKYKIQQFINIIGAILNVIFSLLFIKTLGLVGPAIATILSFLITTIFSYFYCEKKIKKIIS